MKLDKEVLRENRKMAVGCLVCTVLVMAGFLFARQFDYTVVLGGVIGWMLAVGNFFFMSVGITKALETGEENAAKLKMRTSYITRTLVMLAVIAVSLVLDQIHWLPVVASVFYPRIVITALNLFSLAVSRRKHLAGEDAETQEDEKPNVQPQSEDNTEEETDGFEKLVRGFYKAPVPGEENKKQDQSSD